MTTKYGATGTERIAYASAINVLHAIRFCTDSGTPITHMLTISLEWLPDSHDAGRVLKELRARVARWWSYERDKKGRDLGPIKLAVIRANPGHQHAHWLQHMPEELALEVLAVVVNRLSKIAGVSEAVATDACHLEPVPAPGSLAKYVLKGIQPEYADFLHIKAVDEGFIAGRRTSVSRAISRAGRKDAGWVRKRRGSSKRPVR